MFNDLRLWITIAFRDLFTFVVAINGKVKQHKINEQYRYETSLQELA